MFQVCKLTIFFADGFSWHGHGFVGWKKRRRGELAIEYKTSNLIKNRGQEHMKLTDAARLSTQPPGVEPS